MYQIFRQETITSIAYITWGFISKSQVTNTAGDIKERGLVLPFSKEIYKPMLKKLELEGIVERREVETEDF